MASRTASMDTWIAKDWLWLFGAISAAALFLKSYAKRHQSLLGREIPMAPERALLLSGGIFMIILGAGILTRLKTDEVALATLGLGVVFVAAGMLGHDRFARWLIGGLMLAT